MATAGWGDYVPQVLTKLPLAGQSLGWLVPVLVTLAISYAVDRALASKRQISA